MFKELAKQGSPPRLYRSALGIIDAYAPAYSPFLDRLRGDN